MFKKNEMLKTTILTGLVLFATIGLFTIVLAPDGMSPVKAFRSQSLRGGIIHDGGTVIIYGCTAPC